MPPGWRGWLIWRLGERHFHAGVEDSLHRLKRAAEEEYRKQEASQAK